MNEIKVGKYTVVIEQQASGKYTVKRSGCDLTSFKSIEYWHKHCDILVYDIVAKETIWATNRDVIFDCRAKEFADYDSAVVAAHTFDKTAYQLTIEREDKAWALHQAGNTYKKIGEILNVPAAKASKMAGYGQRRVIVVVDDQTLAKQKASLLSFEIQKAKALLEAHGYNVIQKPE